jgi:release factor glutamine methyltransferase
MTIAEALRESGLTPLDAELLAAYACGKDRTWITGHALDALPEDQITAFRTLADRRRRGEPVAYILGQKEFFGRPFRVTPATLIPRPATEELVQTALDALSGHTADRLRSIDTGIVAWCECEKDLSGVNLVIDIGTGSGCVGITLALERPDLQVIATDISADAIDTAQKNAAMHGVSDRIVFKQGSGLTAAEPIDQPFFLVSNPPYIPDEAKLERDVADFEPAAALFAGEKGMDILYPLIEEARRHPLCRGFIVECREEQVF